MKLSKLALALGVLAIPYASAGELKISNHPDKVIANQYIVVFKSDALLLANPQLSTSNMSAAVASSMSTLAQNFNAVSTVSYTSAIQGGVFTMSEKTAQAMAKSPLVDFIEPDEIITISATQNSPTWGLDRIDQRSNGLDSQYTYDTNASNVNVYVIDTGVNRSHSDLEGRVSGGYDAVDNDYDASDCQGHGTHVAGTVASRTYGVAKSARIVPVRVLDCSGRGTNSGVIKGIDWVAQNHSKPAVSNMSLGGGYSSAINNATSNMVNSGVTSVVAAGNDDYDACYGSPASTPEAITVAASTYNDTRSYFSNHGSCVDIFAPGSSITSTDIGGGSSTKSGTSMASPHVAGVAALYLASNPGASPSQVWQAIKDKATPGVISDVKGSPNLLAYSRFGGTPPPPPPPGKGLVNGVPKTDLAANKNGELKFHMDVPAGSSNLEFRISGGRGDADLYVNFGSEATRSNWECRPYDWGNDEICRMSVQEGTYHIMLHGYSSFSGVSLVGTYRN